MQKLKVVLCSRRGDEVLYRCEGLGAVMEFVNGWLAKNPSYAQRGSSQSLVWSADMVTWLAVDLDADPGRQSPPAH